MRTDREVRQYEVRQHRAARTAVLDYAQAGVVAKDGLQVLAKDLGAILAALQGF